VKGEKRRANVSFARQSHGVSLGRTRKGMFAEVRNPGASMDLKPRSHLRRTRATDEVNYDASAKKSKNGKIGTEKNLRLRPRHENGGNCIASKGVTAFDLQKKLFFAQASERENLKRLPPFFYLRSFMDGGRTARLFPRQAWETFSRCLATRLCENWSARGCLLTDQSRRVRGKL